MLLFLVVTLKMSWFWMIFFARYNSLFAKTSRRTKYKYSLVMAHAKASLSVKKLPSRLVGGDRLVVAVESKSHNRNKSEEAAVSSGFHSSLG